MKMYQLKKNKHNYQTQSYCPKCGKLVDSWVDINSGKVIIYKRCKIHGFSTALHRFDDPDMYSFLSNLPISGTEPAGGYIELTRRCNLKCPICYNSSGEDEKYAEIRLEQMPSFHKQKYVCLTGGEPTLRSDLFDIIKKYKSMRKKVLLYSNGLKLTNSFYVARLKKAGLDCLLLSFDGFRKNDYIKNRGRPLLEVKFKALKNLLRYSISVYLLVPLDASRYFVIDSDKYIRMLRRYPNIRLINFAPIIGGRRKQNEAIMSTSEVFGELLKALGLEKSDFFDSTRLAVNLANISPGKKGFIHLPKCNLYCPTVLLRNRLVPITRIFDIGQLNRVLEKDKSAVIWFFNLLHIIWKELFMNFFRNKGYRSILYAFLKEYLSFSAQKHLNMFVVISYCTLQTKDNFDINFTRFCNRIFIDRMMGNRSINTLCSAVADIQTYK